MGTEIFESVDCSVCGQSMGQFNVDELIVLMLDGIDTVKCFDCEPKECEQSPAVFKSWYTVVSSEFEAGSFTDVEKGLRQSDVSLARAHDARMRACLSSSTYLNRNNKKPGVLFDLQEYGECPECKGLGWTNGNSIQFHCPTCNGDGEIVKAIFLPLWLVCGVAENA